MNVSRGRLAVSACFIFGAVFLLYTTFTSHEVYLDEGALHPMTYPRVLLGIWISLSALYFFSQSAAVDLHGLLKALPSILLITVSLTAFMVLTPYLGFPMASSLMLFTVFCILHYRNWFRGGVIAIGISLFIWFVFQKLIGLPLPESTLFVF